MLRALAFACLALASLSCSAPPQLPPLPVDGIASQLSAPAAVVDATVALLKPGYVIPFCGGVAIAPDKVLTATHCTDGQSIMQVVTRAQWSAGESPTYTTSVAGVERDLAVLHVPGAAFTAFAEFGPAAQVGDYVFMLGHRKTPWAAKPGQVLRVSNNLLYVEALVYPGDSGSGLFDLQGRLVGITSAKYTNTHLAIFEAVR